MLEKIYELLLKVFKQTTNVELHDKKIEKLNKEVKELNKLYRDLIIAINRVADRQESEREKILTLVENQLLKFERRLPSGKEKDDKKDQFNFNSFKFCIFDLRTDVAETFAFA